MVVTFIIESLKDCLMNEVILLRLLTMELLQSLKRDRATFNHGTIINVNTVYETSRNFKFNGYQFISFSQIVYKFSQKGAGSIVIEIPIQLKK